MSELIRKRWPTLVGGPLDGQDAPILDAEQRRYGHVSPAGPYWQQEDPTAAVPVDVSTYVRHKVPFVVMDRVIELDVWAYQQLTAQQVAWLILSRSLGVEGE